MGLVFVAGPIVLIAGVKSGQVETAVLEELGLLPAFRRFGLLPPPPPVEKRAALLRALDWLARPAAAGNVVSTRVPEPEPEPAVAARARARAREGEGEGEGHTPPAALAQAQDWVVAALERVADASADVPTWLQTLWSGEDSAGERQDVVDDDDAVGRDVGVAHVEDDEMRAGVEQAKMAQERLLSAVREAISGISGISASALFDELTQHRPGPEPAPPPKPIRQGGLASNAVAVDAILTRKHAAMVMGHLPHIKTTGKMSNVKAMLENKGVAFDKKAPWFPY